MEMALYKEYLIKHSDLGFVLCLEEGETLDDYDVAEYFLDAVQMWVSETHPDDVRDRLTVEDF